MTFAIETSFWCPSDKLLLLQTLVKQHGAYFLTSVNPSEGRDTYVNLGFVCGEDYKKFTDDWYRITTPIRETKTSRWKQLLRRMFA